MKPKLDVFFLQSTKPFSVSLTFFIYISGVSVPAFNYLKGKNFTGGSGVDFSYQTFPSIVPIFDFRESNWLCLVALEN